MLAVIISVSVLSCGWMLFFYVLNLKVKNMILLDFAWASCFAFLSGYLILISRDFYSIKTLILLLPMIWSLRLSYFLLQRVKAGSTDERYEDLKKNNLQKWGAIQFILFFLEALLVVFLYIPFIHLFLIETVEINFLLIMSLIFYGGALMGEVLADRQLRKFKKQSKSLNEICQNGMWKYSRHPNYFFECLIWISYFFMMLTISEYLTFSRVALLLISPSLMVILICFVTGIPPAEKLALKKKGKSYESYQRKTSVLIPWFPKEKNE